MKKSPKTSNNVFGVGDPGKNETSISVFGGEFVNISILLQTFVCLQVTKKEPEGSGEKRLSREKGPAPPPPVLPASTEESKPVESQESGSSPSDDKPEAESLFRPKSASIQSEPDTQSSEPPPFHVSDNAIRPISSEDVVDLEDKVISPVQSSTTTKKDSHSSDENLAETNKHSSNIALVTTKSKESISSVPGDITVLAGKSFHCYFCYLS